MPGVVARDVLCYTKEVVLEESLVSWVSGSLLHGQPLHISPCSRFSSESAHSASGWQDFCIRAVAVIGVQHRGRRGLGFSHCSFWCQTSRIQIHMEVNYSWKLIWYE